MRDLTESTLLEALLNVGTRRKRQADSARCPMSHSDLVCPNCLAPALLAAVDAAIDIARIYDRRDRAFGQARTAFLARLTGGPDA